MKCLNIIPEECSKWIKMKSRKKEYFYRIESDILMVEMCNKVDVYKLNMEFEEKARKKGISKSIESNQMRC